MGILNIQISQAGLVGTIPTPIYINTNDTYAVVTVTGYLNEAHQLGEAFSGNQMALVETSDQGPVWLKVVVSGSDYSLLGSGQYIESIVDTGASLSLATGVALNITSIELPDGLWNVTGSVRIALSAGTTSSDQRGAISTVSATLPTDGVSAWQDSADITGSAVTVLATPTQRLSLVVPTTIYLVAFSVFAVSGATTAGYIAATRVV